MATGKNSGTFKASDKVTTNAELLSYIINENPILSADIDLPIQGDPNSVKEIGKIIVNNQRYRNAFINTVNLIGLTVIKRNMWNSPWDFTVRGELRFGQTVREIVLDLVNVYDYNENYNNKARFLETAIPNVFQYLHEINFQKFYETTTNDNLTYMAFTEEYGIFDFIEQTIGMLWQSYIYDKFLVDKYQLCRRIVDGTVTPVTINNYSTITPRQRVAVMKNVSNKMTFRSPNYNPAGIRRSTSFDDQIFILSTEFEADLSTEVLATSFFRDEADLKARCVLIDSFATTDEKRLQEVLGSAYVSFSESEKTALSNVPAVIISKEWFMDYHYNIGIDGDGSRVTEFYNPVTHDNNHFLSVWDVFSTSPFENAVVFNSAAESSVVSITVTPSRASLYSSQDTTLQFNANVITEGFANKAVVWEIESTSPDTGDSVSLFSTIDANGLFHYDSRDTTNIDVVARSVFDNTKTSTIATITVTEV